MGIPEAAQNTSYEASYLPYRQGEYRIYVGNERIRKQFLGAGVLCSGVFLGLLRSLILTLLTHSYSYFLPLFSAKKPHNNHILFL